jgi:hypothetical protein
MSRWFNIADPCRADIHYMLPPTIRLPNLERVIEQHNYFVIHAPRQTGKTTAMLASSETTDRKWTLYGGYGICGSGKPF